MDARIIPLSSLSSAWEVLLLFLIPVGGGIPAGVLMARQKGLEWSAMLLLYFISDVVLACLFEPLLLLFIMAARRAPFLARLREVLKKTVEKTTSHYGSKAGPLALVLISFGVDPMTGRAAAVAAGHGFISGWLLAIVGDMFYFTVLMVSTLWLNSVLGDGTWTTVIILAVMMGAPVVVRKFRGVAKQPQQKVTPS